MGRINRWVEGGAKEVNDEGEEEEEEEEAAASWWSALQVQHLAVPMSASMATVSSSSFPPPPPPSPSSCPADKIVRANSPTENGCPAPFLPSFLPVLPPIVQLLQLPPCLGNCRGGQQMALGRRPPLKILRMAILEALRFFLGSFGDSCGNFGGFPEDSFLGFL